MVMAGSNGPDLSPETIRRVDVLFPPENRERAKALLYEQCGNNLPFLEKLDMYRIERFRFAALKYSDGDLDMLERAVKLAQKDWRDLLMAVGFGDVGAHRKWEPKPAGEPALIDAAMVGEAIHSRLAAVLIPLGFERQSPPGDPHEWRRSSEVPQSLRVLPGLASRVEARFFLQVMLEAMPVAVRLHLPPLPRMDELREQGYIFRAGGDHEAVFRAMLEDLAKHAQPLFERFVSPGELARGFEDGSFKPHLRVGDQAWIFPRISQPDSHEPAGS